MVKRLLICAVFVISILAGAAMDIFPKDVCEQFGVAPELGKEMVELYTDEASGKPVPDFVKVAGMNLSKNMFLMRIEFAREPDFQSTGLIIYLDYDKNKGTGRQDQYHKGVDVMITISNRNCEAGLRASKITPCKVGAIATGKELWILFNAPIHVVDGNVDFDLQLLAESKPDRGKKIQKSSRVVAVKMPFNGEERIQKGLRLERGCSLVPLSSYGYYNNKIALLPLKDKGLTAAAVGSLTTFKAGRPCPQVALPSGDGDKGKAAVELETITLNLKEEAGVARNAAGVRVGVPMPKGRLFQTAQMRLLDPSGMEKPAQFAVMGRWPDGSLKWVLVQFDAKLAAGENADWKLEFGEKVSRAAVPNPIKVSEDGDEYVVDTGAIRARIGKKVFAFAEIIRQGKPLAFNVNFPDENGKVFSTGAIPPKSCRIEEQGSERVVIRVEGNYGSGDGAKLMSYIARLTFRKQSPVMEIAWTHINTEIDVEFTDVTSLELNVKGLGNGESMTFSRSLENSVKEVTVTRKAGEGALTAFQLNDLQALIPGEKTGDKVTRLDGAFVCRGADNSLGVAIRDLWKRWPKAVTIDGNGVTLGILPPQPGVDYGRDLPFWLIYPFISGKYRTKWGMAFTERILVDAGATLSRAELAAECDWPVIAVVSAQWYDTCKVFGDVAVPKGQQFSLWDQWFQERLDGDQARREKQREYGYFNYGDSFGERGRNWTNNEYDYAHGMLMQFIRTGNREYFRRGMAAARHQADVDIVHAYPDPFFIGANHQHSIGHTGVWSQTPVRATWTHKYDSHTDARNGHTWVEGMTDAWCLAADPRAMEAAYELGEHITWAMSFDFKELGTHERSAGWSLKAIMALYKQFGDTLYLEAAKRIVEVPLKEQKFDNGGAWPHVLPSDHSGSEPGAVGNNMFLLGTLLSGMKDFYEVTEDPRVAKSIVSAARWIMLSYDPEKCGWPYAARVDGKPLWPHARGGSSQVPQGIAFAGLLTGERKFIDAAHDTIYTMIMRSRDNSGKTIASNTIMMPNTIALLQRWYEKYEPANAMDVMAGDIREKRIGAVANAVMLRFRSPNKKNFVVKLTADKGQLNVIRVRTGAMEKRDEFCTVSVKDPAGKEVGSGKCSTDDEKTFSFEINGKAGDMFTVQVHDDQRGAWHVTGKNALAMGKVEKGTSFGSIGMGRYFVNVPPGTKSFKLRLTGIHNGVYGCQVEDANRKVVAKFEDTYSGDAQISTLGGVTNWKWFEVDCSKAAFGKPWCLLLYASQDLGLEISGIPSFIAIGPEQIFNVK